MRKILNSISDFVKKKKEILVPAVILLALFIVATVILGVANFFTADIITKFEADTQIAAMQEVLPAENYTKTDGKEIYTAEKNGAVAGYIFITSAKGYGGDIEVMTAVDHAGKILAVNILSASDESPRLGQNVTKEAFYTQYIGLSNGIADGEINAVAGATFSSNAVTTAVNEALTLYSDNFGDAAVSSATEQEETVNEQ